MSKSFLSADWYRVAPLRLRLRGHVEIHRQQFRNTTWYIVQDHHTGKFHRMAPAANLILCRMNGRRTIQELWETACERFEDDPPTQSEVVQLLSQLHAADLIAGDLPPDIDEMGRRHFKQERQNFLARLRNPLAMRFPIMDPDAFLEATMWAVRPLFTIWGFLAWLALASAGVVLALMNWAPLTENLADRVLTVENGLLIAFAYPLIKAIHELGHAYAAKAWGGEVHEIGVMLLVLIPVPYVDASTSSAFPEKWRRAIVGGAGIMVELALAALALIFWLSAEPGIARAFAFNVMLIGGVSTLLFNGNPLLRFDGYFVLCDLIEIPNLGTRANKYFWYIVQQYVLDVKDVDNPVTAPGERTWFLIYSVAAFLYRVMISITISLFIASKLFFIGIALAIWALTSVLLLPLFKGVKFVVGSPKLRSKRARTCYVAAAVTACIAALIFILPLPLATVAQGVVWLDENTILRASAPGFVKEVTAERQSVAPGASILRMEDPVLASEVRLTRARLAEMRLRLTASLLIDLVQADLVREQINHLESRLGHATSRSAALALVAHRSGKVLVPRADDLIGHLIKEGDVLGYLIDGSDLRLRVAVEQAQAELVRSRTQAVQILFQRNLTRAIPAKLVRQIPESQASLPSSALSTKAGGDFALDPTDPSGRRTVQSVFQFEVLPSVPTPVTLIGERALIRFDHGWEPVAYRMYRSLRQLFLRHFNV